MVHFIIALVCGVLSLRQGLRSTYHHPSTEHGRWLVARGNSGTGTGTTTGTMWANRKSPYGAQRANRKSPYGGKTDLCVC